MDMLMTVMSEVVLRDTEKAVVSKSMAKRIAIQKSGKQAAKEAK